MNNTTRLEGFAPRRRLWLTAALWLVGLLVTTPALAVDAVTGASPAQVPVNQASFGLWVTGRGFRDGATVTISGDGIASLGRAPTVVPQAERFDGGLGDGMIVAFSVAANATNGPRDITITDSNGTSLTAYGVITIVGGQGGPVDPDDPDDPDDPNNPDPPDQAGSADVVARASPRSANQGDQVNLWVVGRSFAQGSEVSFSVAGLNQAQVAGTPISPIVYRNVETIGGESYDGIQYFLRIAPDAPTGFLDITVHNPDGSSASATKIFEVTAPGQDPAPVPGQDNIDEITSASPEAVRAGSPAALWILGKGFASGAEISFSNAGILTTLVPEVVPEASNTPGQSGMRVHVNVDPDATRGPVDVVIRNPNGTTKTAPGLFAVLGAAGGPNSGGAGGQLVCPDETLFIEALERVVPPVLKRGEVRTIAIQGVAFACGASVVINGGGMRALDAPQLVTDANDRLRTTMYWHIEVAADAPSGPRDVVVVNPNNSSKRLAAAFTIEGDIKPKESVSFCSTAPGQSPPGPLSLLFVVAALGLRRRRR